MLYNFNGRGVGRAIIGVLTHIFALTYAVRERRAARANRAE